jgi:hypothetical protein
MRQSSGLALKARLEKTMQGGVSGLLLSRGTNSTKLQIPHF